MVPRQADAELSGLLVGIKDGYLIVAVGEEGPDPILRLMPVPSPSGLSEPVSWPPSHGRSA